MIKRTDTLVFIPTYNECSNVSKLYAEIKRLSLSTDILFCDDNSPDGTGKIIDSIVAQDRSVHVIHRPEKLGLGTAHIEAYKFARQNGYDYLITMDADFTHHPMYIPDLLSKKQTADIVIGSRYISGGKMTGWGRIRLPFTYLWRGLIKYGLGMPFDCTGAFRLYQVSILKPELYKQFCSIGFSFCIESIYYFKKNGAHILEIPIQAHNRLSGKSKLSTKIMREGARMYLVLLFDRLMNKNNDKNHAKSNNR